MQENKNSFANRYLRELLQSPPSNDLWTKSNVSAGCRLRQNAGLKDAGSDRMLDWRMQAQTECWLGGTVDPEIL